MCDTNFHAENDDLLLALEARHLASPLAVRMILDHPYGDECCRIEAPDGPPRLKARAEPWGVPPWMVRNALRALEVAP